VLSGLDFLSLCNFTYCEKLRLKRVLLRLLCRFCCIQLKMLILALEVGELRSCMLKTNDRFKRSQSAISCVGEACSRYIAKVSLSCYLSVALLLASNEGTSSPSFVYCQYLTCIYWHSVIPFYGVFAITSLYC